MSRFFGSAVHAAFVVPDLEREMQRLLKSGEGPFFVMRGIRVACRYRGRRHDPWFSAAFLYSGGMQYEFVEQHDDTPSAYLEFIRRHPQGGMHHLAYFCTTFEQALRSAEERGTRFQAVQEFIYPDESPYEIYVEPVDAPDPILTQLMIPSPIGALFDSMQSIAADWDGREPIRDALAMLPVEMRPPVEPVPGAHR